MNSLLFDTSAVIGLVERESARLGAIARTTTTPIVVSPVTLGELELGFLTDPSERRRISLDAARTTMRPEFFDVAAGPACFAALRAHDHSRMGVNDAWIATTAVTGGHRLVTQDARLVDALDSLDWSSTAWAPPEVELVQVGT